MALFRYPESIFPRGWPRGVTGLPRLPYPFRIQTVRAYSTHIPRTARLRRSRRAGGYTYIDLQAAFHECCALLRPREPRIRPVFGGHRANRGIFRGTDGSSRATRGLLLSLREILRHLCKLWFGKNLAEQFQLDYPYRSNRKSLNLELPPILTAYLHHRNTIYGCFVFISIVSLTFRIRPAFERSVTDLIAFKAFR